MKPINTPARVALYLRAETLTQATRQAALLQQAGDSDFSGDTFGQLAFGQVVVGV
ncbi:hypothetical protein [Jidongwangia harbinensis]|uniref:hypothetical protein n=1 Tax=Jidongwangia harbinensis TaxID=2878561 RepID=UPI001CD97DB7|nr:hypothetical protein [Jidongwangia harbinensis]MCA2219562.1 hypothetical protein [Jidongwangia harbinensis]